ncbi:YitT family protein [Leptotrichia wadei]|jgi:hypothetical protein|uniref:YitT family protein n=1 Tax=Leptotrichia wadei TaxID=157687 RepID=UPI0028DBF0E3|nr:YitT family protein [Leptotrichia wadei]
MNKKTIFKLIKEYFLIGLGTLFLAMGLQFFFFPNKIASGGVTGLALVINSLFGFPTGLFVAISNLILFALAFIVISGQFGFKSIYATVLLSFFLSFFEKFYPNYTITKDIFLATVFGSAICALGITIIYLYESSTGGTSIIARIINKYCHIGYGMSSFIVDAIVTLLAIFAFGVELGLVGLLSVYVTGFITDKFIEGFNSRKQIMIITSNKDIVLNYILRDFDRGCTILKGVGGYSGAEKDILLTIIERRQFIQLRKFLKAHDPTAFVTVTDTTKVFGEGFDQLH